MALIDKASLLMVPSTYEAGTLYNVLPSGNRAPDSTDQNSGYDQTRADFTFDRGSNAAATRIGSNGLIEKYRENVLTYSNQFNTSWSNVNTTETSGQEGYDGTNNAWKLVGNTNASRHYLNKSISKSGINTWSLYAKASGHSYVQFGSGSTANQYANFDLSDGSVGNIGSDFFSAIAEDVGNGWYRLSVVDKVFTNGFYISLVSSKSAAWLESWTMDNATDGILIQNAQLESGMVSTDYLDSGATTAKAGVLIDLPRINYDANGENGSLLLEPSRQQLFQYSEYFGGWTAAGCSISANYAISPEGIKNAYLLTYASGGSRIYDFNNITGTSLAISVFVKGVSGNGCHLLAYNLTSSSVQGDMTFSGNTFTKASGSYSAKSESVGDGWYRVSIVVSGFTSGDNIGVYLYTDNNSGTTSGSSLLAYGFQAEPNASYVSSYIPNHGTSSGVTRAADFNSNNDIISTPISFGANDDFTFYYEGSFDKDGRNEMIMGGGVVGTAADSKCYWWVKDSSLLLAGNGEATMAFASFTAVKNTNYKILVKRNGSAIDTFINGTKLSTTQGATNTGFTFRSLGWSYNNSAYKISGDIKKAIIFKEALTDAECISLTS